MSRGDTLIEFANSCFWYAKEDDSYVIGITEHGLEAIGAISTIDTADIGDEFEFDDWIGELDGKNTALELPAPFSLIVEAINEDVLNQSVSLEDDPTGDAWILRVRMLE